MVPAMGLRVARQQGARLVPAVMRVDGRTRAAVWPEQGLSVTPVPLDRRQRTSPSRPSAQEELLAVPPDGVLGVVLFAEQWL